MQEMNVPLWLTVAAVAVYFIKQWCWPARATRTHDAMRHDWLEATAATKGTEVLGVQTIRNSLMSCTMTATTATLAFMGGVTLLYSIHTQHMPPSLRQHALVVLVLLGLSFVMSMLAARQWHHAGFVAGMPTDSEARRTWQPVGQRCLKRAGHYYAASVRLLMWCVPVLLVGISPVVGLIGVAVMLVVLWGGIDR